MFPKIPEDRTQMSVDDLRALAKEIADAVSASLAEGRTPEKVAEAKTAMADRRTLLAEADAIELKAEAEAPVEKTVTKTAAADEPEKEVEVDVTVPIPPVEAPVPDTVEDETADAEQEAATKTKELATVGGRSVRTTTGLSDTESEKETGRVRPMNIRAKDGVSQRKPGETFESWTEFAGALVEKGGNVRPNTGEKYEVGSIDGKFDLEHVLTDDPFANVRMLGHLDLFNVSQEELTAAMCAPLEPNYQLGCMNTTRRPVKNSMANFRAPRGGVTIYPSPTLADVAGSAGIWTYLHDADPEALKADCAVIECATSEAYRMYGVYHCLTVKNMLAMTFPELVEAYLNRSAALHSRIGEIQMLEAMAAGILPTDAAALGYGASTTIATQIIQYLALRREQQRWDDVPMVGYAHRILAEGMRIDLSRRRRDGQWEIATLEDVNRAFRDVGIDMTWTLDVASWMPPVPPVSTGGDDSTMAHSTLSALPSEGDILVAPRGKFAAIDRGNLAIGVTGNNIYRDNASNKANEFTFFFENFEGVVDTDSCPADILHFPDLCYNGQQIADLALDCLGVEA